jgi:hypothetical protein
MKIYDWLYSRIIRLEGATDISEEEKCLAVLRALIIKTAMWTLRAGTWVLTSAIVCALIGCLLLILTPLLGSMTVVASYYLFSLALSLGAAAFGLFVYFVSVTLISVFIKIELNLRRIADQN